MAIIVAQSVSGGTPETTSSTNAAGAASAPAAATNITIGVSLPILDTYLQQVADGIKDRAATTGAEVTILEAEESSDLQLNHVQGFIAQKVDAMIVVPVDTGVAGPLTKAAQRAEIPLVYVNRRPDDLPGDVPFVGSDSQYASRTMMEELAKLAGGQGNVVILRGDPAHEAAHLRTQGCRDVVSENPGMKVISERDGDWDRAMGQQIMEDWLASGAEIDIVCANNDEMALGAIKALKNAGTLDEVLVGGLDAAGDALAAVEKGDLEVTMYENVWQQGLAAVDAAVELVNGEQVTGEIEVPYQTVTSDNIAGFVGG